MVRLRAEASALLAEADRIESQECTGLAAVWCHLHGDCVCPDRAEALDDPDCPLHSTGSSHAEARAQPDPVGPR